MIYYKSYRKEVAELNYEKLLQMKNELNNLRLELSQEALESFDKSFDIEYAHNSTAIEGNTLTLIQTKAVIEDRFSVGGKTLREIYEVTNHAKAFDYVTSFVVKLKGYLISWFNKKYPFS